MRSYGHFIGGRFVTGETGALIDRRCPGNGALVARFAAGTRGDAELAVEAARHAFDAGPWPRLSGRDRSRILRGFADRMVADRERLARIEAEEVGKPIRFARQDIEGAAEVVHYAAGLAADLHGLAYPALREGQTGLVLREPAGVAGLIIPWNFPAFVFCHKVPFALAAGCTMVVKPSEFTSGTALELARLASEAGVPDGVLNVVTGTGDPVGEAITSHPGVDLVSFTGSTAVGRRVMRNATADVRRTALELGGKGANIVLADAELDAAVEGALHGIYFNMGEVCCAGSRLLVDEAIADAFLSRLCRAAQTLRIGDPLDEETDIGALIHENHVQRVAEFVEAGRREGGKVLCGGSRLTEGALGAGCFYAPTVIDRVEDRMTIFRDEIFGPVLSVMRFKGAEQAIATANNTRYGLANAVWTRDLEQAMRLWRALRSGVVWVNTILEVAPQMPFGGVKESGFGREFGHAGLEEFTEIKSIYLTTGKRPPALRHG
jgi:betaine-aldehyde dehydrogenase